MTVTRHVLRLITVCMLACLFLVQPGIAGAASPGEQTRIDRLLDALGRQKDLVFIRNGSEHTAEAAVKHLKLKRRRAENRITTAEQFIDMLASSSSLSQKPYMIQRPGQTPKPAGQYLHNLLREVAPQ